MNKRNFCLLTALFLIFGVMMSACTATKTNDKVSTNGTTLSSTIIDSPSTIDTTTGSTTTTAITTTELAAITTTSTKKLTTTSQTQSTASPTRRPAETIKAKGEITFDYNSDDFTALRQYIQKKFPNEKNLAEFRAKKIEETNKGYDGFRVAFTRWINGCGTDSHYVLYFDTDGALVEIVERSLDYDASKVKAPRVPTEAEIEAAKQAEIEKIPEGYYLWKQEVSIHYWIASDQNFISVTTLYVGKHAYEEYLTPGGQSYGKDPTHAAFFADYTIAR